MRASLLILILALAGSPAAARQPAGEVAIPKELTDPAFTEKLAGVAQALAKAMASLPVGEVKAAIEDREATREEKNLTVGDLAGADNPDFQQDLQRRISEARPAMEGAMQALASALPAMMKGMATAQDELERATANMPQPGYPKR